MHVTLELDRATKSFGSVHALVDGSITLRAGEVHALLGENGAGKSTLVKILAGVHQPDGGELRIDGEPTVLAGTGASRAAGISVIYQEPTLFPDLSVAENIFMGRQPLSWGRHIDRGAMNAAADQGVRPPRRRPRPDAAGPRPVGRRPADRRDRQGDLVRRPGDRDGRADRGTDRGRGRAALHRRAHAARRGRRRAVHLAPARGGVRQLPAGHDHARRARSCAPTRSRTSTSTTVIRSMVGRDLDTLFPKTPTRRPARSCSRSSDLSRRGEFTDVSFTVRRGEIVALAGLVGAGRSEIARAIFGIDRYDAGRVDGRRQRAAERVADRPPCAPASASSPRTAASRAS